MDYCAPFEDYEYSIFGHDRLYFIAIDFISTIFFIPLVKRLTKSIIRLYFISLSILIVPLLLVRIFKGLHVVILPDTVEQSDVYCVCLRIEFTLNYILAFHFAFCTVVMLINICKRRRVIFPITTSHRFLFFISLCYSCVVGGFYANFKEYHLAPSYVYVLQYEMLCVTLLLLPIITGCLSCRGASKYETKENLSSTTNSGVASQKPWNFCWLNAYLFLPCLLQYYQFGMMYPLFMPLFQVKFYDFSLSLSLRYSDAFVSHKFIYTPMSIILPAFFWLPPFRSFFVKPFLRRFRRNDRVATPRVIASARRATCA